MASAIFHWGLHAWAIYAVVGLALAFFSFNRGLPLTLRSAFYPLFGKAVWGPFGHIIDTIAVLATVFGLSTSLGFGAEQIAAGIKYLFGVEDTNIFKISLIVIIISVAMLSVVAGMDKGIKRLSELNMGLAGVLMIFVIVTGPALAIFSAVAQAAKDYMLYVPQLSSWIGRRLWLFTWLDDFLLGLVDFLVAVCGYVYRKSKLRPYSQRIYYGCPGPADIDLYYLDGYLRGYGFRTTI